MPDGLRLGLAGPGAAWSPRRYGADLECWLEPGLSRLQRDGMRIARIDDLSGQGRHAVQAGEGEQPVLTLSDGRSNLVLGSGDLATGWSLTNATIDAAAVVGPDGSATADRLVESTANGTHGMQQGFMALAGETAEAEFAVKAFGRQWLLCAGHSSQFTDSAVWFDVAGGAVGTTAANAAASIAPLGNGWYRCRWAAPAHASSASATLLFRTCLADGDTGTYAGDGTSGVAFADLHVRQRDLSVPGFVATDDGHRRYPALGGRPALWFDPSNDRMTLPALPGPDVTAFFVLRLDYPVAADRCLFRGVPDSDAGGDVGLYLRAADRRLHPFLREGADSHEFANAAGLQWSPGDCRAVAWSHEAATGRQRLWVGGAAEVDEACGFAVDMTGLASASLGGAGFGLGASIGAFAWVSRTLPDAEIAAALAHLSAGLPAG